MFKASANIPRNPFSSYLLALKFTTTPVLYKFFNRVFSLIITATKNELLGWIIVAKSKNCFYIMRRSVLLFF